jgi:hypothetical protein
MGEGLSAGTRSFRAKSDYRVNVFAVGMTKISMVGAFRSSAFYGRKYYKVFLL